jgi:hypothetical protein
MSVLGIEPVVMPTFSLTPSLVEGSFAIKFSGNADMAAMSTLSIYLRAVHAEALELKVREVTFDVRELYFMNSSCFKSLVTWIEAASSARDSASSYKIKFLANAKLHWQRRSLEALRCLADHIVSVDS